MALSQCSIDGYPSVVRVSIDQPSGASPGRIVVDCAMHPIVDAAQPCPIESTLRINARNFVGQWKVIAIDGPRPVAGSRSIRRFIFQDYRHKLASVVINKSFNSRDAMGNIDPATEKTITQLWTELADKTELTITTQTVPNFKPPANWAGKSAMHCAAELLAMTGCRMVYDPIGAKFVINAANAGVMPSINNRFWQRVQSPAFNKLVVQSAPTLYEGIVKAKASWVDDNGALVDLPTPLKYFLGYDDEADLRKRNRLIQSGFRIWKPVSVSHPSNLNWPDNFHICNHRAVVIAHAQPIYQSIAVRHEAGHWNLSGDATGHRIQFRPDAGVITTDKPTLSINDTGVMNTTVDFIAAYYVKDANEYGGWKVLKKQSDLTPAPGGNPVTKRLLIHHVRPANSNRSDGPTAGNWQTLIDAIHDANVPLMQGIAQTATLASLQRTAGCGRIARTRWLVDMTQRPTLSTEFTIDSPPSERIGVMGAPRWTT